MATTKTSARLEASLDERFMARAVRMAHKGLGSTYPNPSVGAVVVRGSEVIGAAHSDPTGGPHAEVKALRQAGAAAKGATLYVTLEPCCHHGRTGPCTGAILESGVARVVIGLRDPARHADGKGIRRLRRGGLVVTEGVLQGACAEVHAHYVHHVQTGRPFVSLKIACSIDGRIATPQGDSKWITGEASRARGHLLRATHDAIMVGSATAIVDDPELTCRLPGLGGRSPIRIVADGRLRLPLTSKLVRDAQKHPLWILTLPGGDGARRNAFEDCGAVLIDVEPGEGGMMDMRGALEQIAARGVTRVLVEGGARLAASLTRDRLVDRIEWFQAAKLIGGDGYPAIAGLGIKHVDGAPSFVLRETMRAGADLVSSYVRSV
mgnify:CR=1 FL=1